MANQLKVIITADDKATAAIKRVSDSISQMVQPISNVFRTTSNIGKAMGVDKIARGFADVGKAAAVTAGSVRSMVEPLGAIAGVGSVAGIGALATEWGRLGLQITQSAQAVGLSTRELQGFNGTAKLFGVSADTMTGGLKAIGDTFEGALFGRNQDALLMLNRLGIGIHKTKAGAIDTARAFMDISRAVSRTASPEVQRLIAGSFGVEAMLPVLVKGPAAIAAYQEQIKRLSGVSEEATQRAADFGMKLNLLSAAGDGLRYSIGDKLIPVIQPLIDQTTLWIGANRALVATKVGDFVSELIIGVPKATKGINDAADAVGGWKNVAIGFGALTTLNMIQPTLELTKDLVKLGGIIGAFSLAGIGRAGAALAGITGAISTPAAIGLGAAYVGGAGIGLGVGYGIGTGINYVPTLFGGQQLSTYFGDFLLPKYDPNKGGPRTPNLPSDDAIEAEFVRVLGPATPGDPSQSIRDIYRNGARAAPSAEPPNYVEVHIHGAELRRGAYPRRRARHLAAVTARARDGSQVPVRVSNAMPTAISP